MNLCLAVVDCYVYHLVNEYNPQSSETNSKYIQQMLMDYDCIQKIFIKGTKQTRGLEWTSPKLAKAKNKASSTASVD